MQTYTVLHNPHFTEVGYTRIKERGNFATFLIPIVKVEAENLEDAYYITNTVTSPWTQNVEKGLLFLHRSTSVGDVIWDEEDDTYWMVDRIGFTKISEWDMANVLIGLPSILIHSLEEQLYGGIDWLASFGLQSPRCRFCGWQQPDLPADEQHDDSCPRLGWAVVNNELNQVENVEGEVA